MKRRYYLSMLSLYLLHVILDSIYFFFHESIDVFLILGLVRLVMFVFINLLGIYFLYKPIDRLLNEDGVTTQAKERIQRLTWYSTGWIFFLGVIFNILAQLPLFINPVIYSDMEVFHVNKMPVLYIISTIPAVFYVNALLPSFITYFLIDDFNFDLKETVFRKFNILYPAGKKRIGLTLLIVFVVLIFIPALLAILEILVTVEMADQYAVFSEMNPLELTLIDRLVVFVGVIIAVVFLSRSFTKPIHSLLKIINKVREGDYTTRAPIMTEDEIGVLTNDFNDMVQELEISHHKLEEYNRTLEQKVEDRTQELKQKNAELEAAFAQLKQMQKQVIFQEKMATLGQMVAGLTHEMNTPISAIHSMNNTRTKAVEKLQIALDKIAPDASVEREIKKVLGVFSKADQSIDQGTDRLSEIINNLKNFARLDEADAVKADIHEGIESVLGLISHDLLKDIEVVREYGDIPPFVCHARKLNQVFLNILKNAGQAIKVGGKITITTGLHGKMAHVAIRDTGKGIKPENLESIFDPNFTTTDSVVRARLGLSICYQIIQEHGGTISVESQPGKGSLFTIIIPVDFHPTAKTTSSAATE